MLLGRTERLPTQLKSFTVGAMPAAPPPSEIRDELGNLPAVDFDDISQLQDQLAALEVAEDLPENDLVEPVIETVDNSSPVDLEALQGEFAALQLEANVLEPDDASVLEPDDETTSESAFSESAFSESALETTESAFREMVSGLPQAAVEIPLVPLRTPPQPAVPSTRKTSTVRVSVEQLKQINSSFESLILNRNSVNLKLDQLQAFSSLMQERMLALASFNKELRQWYDQAATEGPMSDSPRENGVGLVGNGRLPADVAASDELDVLEFDRYSKLHLLAQEHMETIVKLEEVSRDIELGLNEIDQAVSSLNYSSQTLKNRITQTQMRPFEEIVGRFPRVVRDWAVQYGKRVKLQLEGSTTLIEQFALDQLSDPLMHLLRNAFDHGIESPEVRQQQQKSAVGTITLRAVNRGNRVVITLSDDGGGIDLDRVRDRIRQYNLPDDQINNMDRQELLSFIFEPGFSTSGTVTELSGRGFGMDVVRTNLKELQGDIQISTEPGQGTTFTISIPLSLSILRVMLLERHGTVFALPVDTVQEVIRTPLQEITDATMSWKDSPIPLVRVEEHWAMQTNVRPLEMSGQPLINCPMVVVVGEDEQSYGLSVDRFWQEQEVAIRPVVSPMPLPPGFGGVTVLGDGRVVPLIEPIRLIEWIVTAPEQSSSRPTTPTVMPQAQAARILVVDDSIHARQYLATTLERSGYLVEQAKDGRDAVDKLLGGLVVEAVICDIEMPRLDGYGVLEELRDEAQFSDLPILMLTSRSSDKHRKLAINLGATDYFSKPYNEQELLKQLKQYISCLALV